MFKKLTTATVVSLLLATTSMAREHHEKEGEFYIIAKALMTTSESLTEGEDVKLDADMGGGIGIDVGYRLPYHFALELDTSYSTNKVTETRVGEEPRSGTAKYWTYAMDVTYTFPITHHIGLMGKVGYEFEHEDIDALETQGDDSGVVYGGGIEYHINNHYEALVEYEESAIESPRGSSIYAGVKYIF
ncbi:MAG: porin family protein [Campylobacterales bacterium]|nr:porin family protein [Campylobacterales bacterium]